MVNINKAITISYIALQTSIALCVSILGAVHVRRIYTAENIKTLNDNARNEIINHVHKNMHKKQKSFCKLWIKTAWKMRGIYSALAVHSFDILTDILVIVQWLEMTNEDDDGINPYIMAYSALFVLIFSRIVSTIAIFMKERDFMRCILQLFDLLIFQEIYEAHTKVLHQINKKSMKEENTAIESTLSFKYIRNFEAVYESIPQSVLQLVFVMRTSTIEPIFVISIIQSIVSMTNSILNNDFTQMQDNKFKQFKERFPPTFKCFKHSLSRLSEVVYRIGVLSLFWTVCGGIAFSCMLATELLLLVLRMAYYSFDGYGVNMDTLLLNLSIFVVIPSEEVYRAGSANWTTWIRGSFGCTTKLGFEFYAVHGCCFSAFAACGTGILPSIFNCNKEVRIYDVPTFRIALSLLELSIIIITSLFDEDANKFLWSMSTAYGLSLFIVTCIFLVIYSQYLTLFPNFSLPLGIPVRSKWGYAYSNELSELQKVKLRIPSNPERLRKCYVCCCCSKTNTGYIEQYVEIKSVHIETWKTPPMDYALPIETHYFKEWLYQQIRHEISKEELQSKVSERIKSNDFLYKQWFKAEGMDATIEIWLNRKGYQLKSTSPFNIISFLVELNMLEAEFKDYKTYRNLYFWEEPFEGLRVTPAMLALANKHDHIVEWLEGKGALKHKTMKRSDVMTLIKQMEKEKENNDKKRRLSNLEL